MPAGALGRTNCTLWQVLAWAGPPWEGNRWLDFRALPTNTHPAVLACRYGEGHVVLCQALLDPTVCDFDGVPAAGRRATTAA